MIGYLEKTKAGSKKRERAADPPLSDLPDLPGCEKQKMNRVRLKKIGYFVPELVSNGKAHKEKSVYSQKHPAYESWTYQGHYLFDQEGNLFFGEEKKQEILKKIRAADPGFNLQDRDIQTIKNFNNAIYKKEKRKKLRQSYLSQVSIAETETENKRRVLISDGDLPVLSQRRMKEESLQATVFADLALQPGPARRGTIETKVDEAMDVTG